MSKAVSRSVHGQRRAAPALSTLDRARRIVGLRFYRRLTLIRRPVRLSVNFSLHPTVSVGWRRWTVNVNQRGGDLRVAPLTGLAYRRPLWRWPWRAGRVKPEQENDG